MKRLTRILDRIAMSVPLCGALYDIGTKRLEKQTLGR